MRDGKPGISSTKTEKGLIESSDFIVTIPVKILMLINLKQNRERERERETDQQEMELEMLGLGVVCRGRREGE